MAPQVSGANTPVPAAASALRGDQAYSQFDRYFAVFTFSMIGTAGLYPYNAGIMIFPLLSQHVFGSSIHADNLVLVYLVFNLLVVTFLIYFGGVRPKLLLAMLAANLVALLVLPLLFQVSGGGTVALVFVYIIYVIIGVTMELMLGIALALTAIFPEKNSGYIGFGLGASGLAAFIFWYIGDGLFFPRDLTSPEVSSELGPIFQHNRNQLLKTCWFSFGMGSLMVCVCLACMLYILSRPWAKYRMDKYWSERLGLGSVSSDSLCTVAAGSNDTTKNSDSVVDTGNTEKEEHLKSDAELSHGLVASADAIDYGDLESYEKYKHIEELYKPRRPTKVIIRLSFEQLFNIFFITCVNMLLYPIIGPYSWTGPDNREDVVTTFQVVNFFFRLIPNWSPKLRTKMNWLIFFNVGRLFFFPLFIIPMTWSNSFANTTAYQVTIMFLFAASYGWIATQSQLFAPESVGRLKDKGRVGAYAGVARQLGMLSGIVLSRIVRVILDGVVVV